MQEKYEEKIECFVPALALEHHTNAEFCSLKEKIRAAVRRLRQYGDYFDPDIFNDAGPFVIVDDYKFHADALGYQVFARVRSVRKAVQSMGEIGGQRGDKVGEII